MAVDQARLRSDAADQEPRPAARGRGRPRASGGGLARGWQRTAAWQDRPKEDSLGASLGGSPIERDVARVRAGTHDIRDVVSYVEKHVDDDRAVGRVPRRVVRKGTTGEVAAFSAALIDLLRSHPEPKEPG